MKYIAYGSNMSLDQMAHRCPGAKLIGTGYLPNHRPDFSLPAPVKRTRAHDAKVPVAVWEISEEDERSLDRYEGFPTYYSKHRRRVVMDDGTELWGMVYIMNMIRPQPPTPAYYNGIHNAYVRLGLRSEIERVLEPALQRSQQRKRFSLW